LVYVLLQTHQVQPNNIPTAKNSPSTVADKRMQLSSTLSRYYKEDRLIVDATADGVFPAKV
jgi:hypothetical protein